MNWEKKAKKRLLLTFRHEDTGYGTETGTSANIEGAFLSPVW